MKKMKSETNEHVLTGITPVFRRPFWPIGIVFCVSRTILLRSKVVAGKTCKDVARDDVRSRGG